MPLATCGAEVDELAAGAFLQAFPPRLELIREGVAPPDQRGSAAVREPSEPFLATQFDAVVLSSIALDKLGARFDVVLEIGGGLGVPYQIGAQLPGPAEYGAMVAEVTGDWGATIMFEPGRVITGNAGVLLTEVIRVKPGVTAPFVVVDAAMNDLIRPAMYDAWHDFVAVRPSGERMVANIVGPICESSDTFAMGRDIDVVVAGDLAVFRTAGAYGATMANTYNSRPLVPEVMVDGDKWAIVAERIEPATILAAEHVPDWLE